METWNDSGWSSDSPYHNPMTKADQAPRPRVDWHQIFFVEHPRFDGELDHQWFKRLGKLLSRNPRHIATIWYGPHKKRDQEQYKTPAITTDKKEGVFNWREVLEPIQVLQELKQKSSKSQDVANWSIQTDKPIAVVVIGDWHMGSWGTDYELFKQCTEEIINTPNLYVIIVGDMLQMAIKLRGVLEVTDNLLPPKWQMAFLESWLIEIKHKVICSTWDNHSVMREENATGFSMYSEIFSRHTIFHNHIGHIDLHVGKQTYKVAASHHFRGRSELNPCHSPMKYMRYQAHDREIAVQGDYHLPGIIKYTEGGREKVAMVCGSLQTNSGYAKRFFTLTTHPKFPCFTLDPKEHLITPYWSVKEWLNK